MNSENRAVIRLQDYTPPSYLVDTVHLDVNIHRSGTVVTATMAMVKNPLGSGESTLILDGEELETLAVAIDGRPLSVDEYFLASGTLSLHGLPATFVLETRVGIQPDANTHLSGFYRSSDGYFSQCEAQGFRHITWFQDRPDVMARYTVTLHADKTLFPILLANGNPVTSGDEADGRHFATWEDPFKKPCYLFAMVAAKLDVLRDSYHSKSEREVQLAIYVEPGKLDQCDHAMAALKKSMQWDEQRFGLECDLDHYMIVAVGDFNMGAMENKGLNIFNTKYVLARSDTATDTDFIGIDRVVAHEYFHNWTGNRVTCRDWFQLSLKEGLTVFRDQEFGADLHNRATARIQEVRQLRASQFPEDAGPMAHPVRPESYIEINNFYTATVYEKGAEVVRMIQTLIGKESFRKGMDLYFARHDGQAVTCDDFVAAMAAASGVDFTPFMVWYRQAGTPHVTARGDYDVAAARYTLTLRQECSGSAPWFIPVRVGLVGPDGRDMDLGQETFERMVILANAEQSFEFDNLTSAPVPSLLRNFSAPVVLDFPYTNEQLLHLFAHDSDSFNRWEAGQRLYSRLILAAIKKVGAGETADYPPALLVAARTMLSSTDTDYAFIAEALTLPSEATLAEQMELVDPEALHNARNQLAGFLARGLEDQFLQLYRMLAPAGPYHTDAAEIGRRRMRNLCLGYLNELDSADYRAAAQQQFVGADNMTDQFGALSILANSPGEAGDAALATFLTRWQTEALVVDKWLMVQATSRRPDTAARVKTLLSHPAFDIRNPNKVYALLRNFGANHRFFHAGDGSGYRLLAEQIALIDSLNPQVASRLARCFDRWKKFDAVHQNHARAALTLLKQHDGLSSNVFEVVQKALS